MRRRSTTVVAVALALGGCVMTGAAASAAGFGGARQTVTAAFSSSAPGTPTGLTLTAVYGDGLTPPGPPTVALVHVDDGLPPGTVIANGAVPQCTAAAAELIASGPSICPAGSIVGSGSAEIGVGLPSGVGRVTVPLTLINAPGHLLFLGRFPALRLGMIDTGTIDGATVAIPIPHIPGLGVGGAVVDAEQFSISAGSGLLRTPAACPAAGWVLRRTQAYADGVVQVTRVVLPCGGA